MKYLLTISVVLSSMLLAGSVFAAASAATPSAANPGASPLPLPAAKPCLTTDQINGILSNYEFYHWDNSQRTWISDKNIDKCDDKNILHRAVSTILFINQFPKISVPDGQFTSQVVKEGPANFFKKRISKILIETNEHADVCAQEGIVAYVQSNETQDRIMHLCPYYTSAYGASDLMSSYVLLHEARHIEGYAHTLCDHGALAAFDHKAGNLTSGACDSSFEQQGSYGIGAGYIMNVYQSSKNEALKQEARANTVADMVQRFNKLPLDINLGALLQQQDGTISFYDGKDHPMFQQKDLKVLALRNDMPTFFNKDGSVKTYAYSKTLTDTAGAFADIYRSTLTPAQRDTLLDVYYGVGFSCLLYQKSMHCGGNGPNDKDIDIPLNAIKPLRLVVTAMLGDIEQLSILDEDHIFHGLPVTYAELAKSTEADFVAAKVPNMTLSYANVANNQMIAVVVQGDSQGMLIENSPTDEDVWTPIKEYIGKTFEKVVPFYWSQKLQDL